MPLKFTDRALVDLRALLDDTEHEPGQLVRMVPDVDGNLHLVLDVPEKGDQVVEHQGEPLLVIKKSTAHHVREHMGGDTLDTRPGPDGPTLIVIVEPKA